MPAHTWPEWEHVLSAAAHLQVVLSGATLVGGTAAAVYAGHRVSYDLDETNLAEYRRLDPMWQDWQRVTQRCAAIASDIFRRL